MHQRHCDLIHDYILNPSHIPYHLGPLFAVIDEVLFDYPAYTTLINEYYEFDPHYLWICVVFSTLSSSSYHLPKDPQWIGKPMLSTMRWRGWLFVCGTLIFGLIVLPLLDRVVWSGTGSLSFINWNMDATKPSVCCRGR